MRKTLKLAALLGVLLMATLGLVPPTSAATNATISGRVLDTSGAPVSGLTVVADSETEFHVVQTDGSGNYVMRDVEEGDYELYVDDDFYGATTYEIVAASPGTQQVQNLTVDKGAAIDVKVTDMNGAPLEGVMFGITPCGTTPANPIVGPDTDVTGELRLTQLPANTTFCVYYATDFAMVPGFWDSTSTTGGAPFGPGTPVTLSVGDVKNLGTIKLPVTPRKTVTIVGLPVISGVAQVGSNLSVTCGSIIPAIDRCGSYSWWRMSADQTKFKRVVQPNIFASTYVPGPDDVGTRVFAVVEPLVYGYYKIAPQSSDLSEVIKAAPIAPVPPHQPTRIWGIATAQIVGKPKVGRVLTVVNTPAGVGVSYQWLRDGKAIPGATGASYKLKKKDRPKPVYCVLTYKYANGDWGYAQALPIRRVR